MKKYIPTLMSMYSDMQKENEKQAIKYKKAPLNKYGFNEEKKFIFSDTMMHSIITIISKIENFNPHK